MPTAANMNLYRGWKSCVGWHRDDEPLFGKCGDAMLIVSVSFGSSAVFKWRRQSCPDDEGHLCCLGHGGILVMDGQCQDEFLHRTPWPGTGKDKHYVPSGQKACILLSFAEGKEWHAVCQRVRRVHQFLLWGILFWAFLGLFLGFLVSPWCLVHMGSAGLSGLPVVYKTWVTEVCLLLDTPFGRRSVGALPL